MKTVPRTQKKPERSRRISHLFCLARDASLDNERLHMIVEGVTGKESIKKLTMRELREVELAIKPLIPKKKRPRRKKAEGVEYLATPDQKDKVEQLLIELTPIKGLRDKGKYVNAVARRMFRKNFDVLKLDEMQKLIEALKSIIQREKDGGDQ